MNIFGILILMFLLIIPISLSTELSCRYNENPYIREKISYIWDERNLIWWMCNVTQATGKSFSCMSYVYFNNNLIQSNPRSEYIESIGTVDTFTPQPENETDQIVGIYFTNKDLRDNRWVMFQTICSDGNETLTFEKNITPQYKDPYEIFDVAEYGRINAGTILGIAFSILFIIILIGIIWRLTKA